MKKIACIIIALVVLMIVSLASAEEVECQMQWGELTQKYPIALYAVGWTFLCVIYPLKNKRL